MTYHRVATMNRRIRRGNNSAAELRSVKVGGACCHLAANLASILRHVCVDLIGTHRVLDHPFVRLPTRFHPMEPGARYDCSGSKSSGKAARKTAMEMDYVRG